MGMLLVRFRLQSRECLGRALAGRVASMFSSRGRASSRWAHRQLILLGGWSAAPRAWSVTCAWCRAGTLFRAGCVSGGGVGFVRWLGAEAEPGDGLDAQRSSAGAGRYAGDARQSPDRRGADGRRAVPVDGVGRHREQRRADRRYGAASRLPDLAGSGRVGRDRAGFGSPAGVRVGVVGVSVAADVSSRCRALGVTMSRSSAGRVRAGRRVWCA